MQTDGELCSRSEYQTKLLTVKKIFHPISLGI